MVGCLTGNRVQIIIRTTDTERDQVKKLAQEKDVSMNQFILDAIFDSTSDSSDSKSDIKMWNGNTFLDKNYKVCL